MKSIVCIEPGSLALKERPVPPCDNSLVRVNVKRVGICGTDFHIFKGQHPYLEYPRVIGHELSGVVANAPKGSEFEPGDEVLINPYLLCGTCSACRKQKPNCCANIQVLGVHTDGGLCETIDLPAAQLYKTQGLSLQQAAMVEFLAIGAHAVRRGEIRAKDRVLVVGAGPIGLGVALFASIVEAEVYILDANKARVSKATELVHGAVGLTLDDHTEARIEELTEGELFDVVLDATGNKSAMEASIRSVGHGGSCVFVSIVKDDITFEDPVFHAREMRLIASRNATREDFEHVMQCMRAGIIPTNALNTHTCAIEEFPEKIEQWLLQPNELIKAVVTV